MNLSKLRSSLIIILVFILAACSQLPSPTNEVLESQLTEIQKISSSDASGFGYDVAVDGDFMVVAATSFESAYLYQKDISGSWQFVKKLVASDSVAGNFGSSVAISGNTIIVGALADDIGTNTNQGSAYIFERNRGGTNNWGEVKKLVASDGDGGDSFGGSVAISGNTLVVVAPGDDIGIKSNQGSAYIFYRNRGGTNAWGQAKKLLASDGREDAYFGSSVSISANTLVIGVLSDNVGTNINQGSAYIYERDQGGTNTWGEVKKLIASDGAGSDWFGSSVAISSNTVVIGAPNHNGAQGSAYLFERNQGGANTWDEVKELVASDGTVSYYFGYSVAISGNTVVVGIPGRGNFRGAAYLYKRDSGGLNMWGQTRRLFASDRLSDDQNGHSVAISGTTIVVGAPRDDSDTNANQGSVYIFFQ
jgi:FG-GAP repeat